MRPWGWRGVPSYPGSMGPEIVWQGVGPNLVSAAITGLVALWVVYRTNLGAERNARQERLEAALAQLILGVAAAYTQPHQSTSRSRLESWEASAADARVKVMLLTGSSELDERLAKLTGEWLSSWRLLDDYAAEMAVLVHNAAQDHFAAPADIDPEDAKVYRAAEEMRLMGPELTGILRELRTPTPEHAQAVVRRLDEWHGRLRDYEHEYGDAPLRYWYESRGMQVPPEFE